MELSVPELSLVVLVGASGSGKSTFAAKRFLPSEVLSSDYCRGLVADDENDQSATNDAFEILHFIAGKRMGRGRLTVVDATNVKREDRAKLIRLAREHHFLPVAIVLDVPEGLCQERNRARPERDFGPHVIRNQVQHLRRGLRGMRKEGFRQVHLLDSPQAIDDATITRTRLWNNRTDEHGPFDIIGDVHGCCEEVECLLAELGYGLSERRVGDFPEGGPIYAHPEGRTAVFVGDLVDRGPRILDTIRLVRNMVDAGSAHCVPGNHDIKLVRKLRGRDVPITHGLDRSLAELEALPEERRDAAAGEVVRFLDSLVSHYVYDDGKLVVAHAGLKEEMQGRGSGKVRDFALYGETTGETDEFGLPIRWDWAAEYRGRATVVYGHTPVPEAEWLNRTINIDTGCVFGGRLTALRYPENALISVAVKSTYAEPARPLRAEESLPMLTEQQREDELLDIDDVIGKRIIPTRLAHNVTIREENAIAALEVMGRFAINPKWLVYLPPAVSPSATSEHSNLLEHPAEAFAYYRQEGVPRVVCEEKHMGSRAIVIVCRDEHAARRRFGVVDDGFGACFTRTGRPLFEDDSLRHQLLSRTREAAANVGLFDRLEADWLLLDCELMPWSAKAQELLREQYAAVGAAAGAGLGETLSALERAAAAGIDVAALIDRFRQRGDDAARFVEAYRRYCWPIQSIEDIKLAPFHLLASNGSVHADKTHLWHMETLSELCVADPVLYPTAHFVVDTTDRDSEQAGEAWWTQLTERGGEGMVVKPFDYVVRGRRGLTQPALKTRGREYLRIIYGPDYTEPENLARLRDRGLGRKRSLAIREFALGIEALERFVRGEPLRRVHECVFGVLALESEPVDPRL
ncbi:MAG: polynucleotide kinase-phosphatase [Actinomycetota bacterium]|nr:polynucleotide kinase-phosphatase [Actinomycetota bacterium]